MNVFTGFDLAFFLFHTVPVAVRSPTVEGTGTHALVHNSNRWPIVGAAAVEDMASAHASSFEESKTSNNLCMDSNGRRIHRRWDSTMMAAGTDYTPAGRRRRMPELLVNSNMAQCCSREIVDIPEVFRRQQWPAMM